jgi:DNA-binding NarL/FixJ family response regulator
VQTQRLQGARPEIPMPKNRILIVDDHGVVIEGIRSRFQDQAEFEVVGEAFNGLQALKSVESLRPDVVIMDISMPELNGVEATKQIKKLFPETSIVIYTMLSNKEYVIELFRAGISGYVLKQDPFTDLMLALNVVKAGGSYFSHMAPKILSDYLTTLDGGLKKHADLESLSLREREIFKLLADGKSVKEVGFDLFISPKTVESHKYNIMAKLGVQSITELTKIAIKQKVIQI